MKQIIKRTRGVLCGFPKMFVIFIIGISSPVVILYLANSLSSDNSSLAKVSNSIPTISDSPSPSIGISETNVGVFVDSETCNILRIKVYGELTTYIPDTQNSSDNNSGDSTSSESILDGIYQAEEDSGIKGILVMIDSGGGEPVAGQEIADALRGSSKHIVVVIRQLGLSAAYLAATGAKTIFASENSDVGSIGVITYIDNYAVKNQKDGIERQVLSMGKYKGMYDPNKPMTEEEKSLIMRDLKIVYENFIQKVSQNRNLSIAKVRTLADGSSMTGMAALKEGLIDKIGTRLDAEKYIEDEVGETPVYCDL